MTERLRWLRPWTLLVLGGVVAGCTGGPVEESSLELGTGTWRFEPLTDGDSVPLIRGAQGGWHIWLSVRSTAGEESGSLSIAVSPADETRPPQRTTIGVTLDPPDAEGRRVYLGWPAILEDPACAVGELLRIEATFVAPSGQRTTVEREVRVTGGDSPPPPCG